MGEHPCNGCDFFYAEYAVNRCCNYLLDTNRKRPCAFGEGCTVKQINGRRNRR